MGKVYKVVIPGINKIAALKILDPSPKLVQKMGMTWLRDQFTKEAAVIANIRHPNIVEIWNFEEINNHVFYLMEYFCHNLGTLIGENYWADSTTRVVSVERTTCYIIEILQGLLRLHQVGIFHRDIKPFNIMLTDEGVAKIVDFGLSKKRGEIPLTDKNSFIGTKYYAAPEQIESPDEVDQRADLYSVGVMLYRMLTGILPKQHPDPPSIHNPDLSVLWDRFILKSIESKPDNRFQNAGIMSEEIQHVYDVYKKEKIKDCIISDEFLAQSENTKQSDRIKIKLRAKPDRINAKKAKSIFDLNTFNRPNTYIKNNLEAQSNETVIDKTTGLIWQQSGSEYAMQWQHAQDYIEKLNDVKFGGYGNWRIPTVNELLSLLNPPPHGEDFCFEPLFSSIQKWIWSGDSRSRLANWVVNVEMGFVTCSDVMDFFYTKGVCTL